MNKRFQKIAGCTKRPANLCAILPIDKLMRMWYNYRAADCGGGPLLPPLTPYAIFSWKKLPLHMARRFPKLTSPALLTRA